MQQDDRHHRRRIDLVLGELEGQLTTVPVRAPTRATTTAADVGIHRRASSINSTQPTGRKRTVVRRRTSSVLPKSELESRSRKYHPAGNGAPSLFRASNQFPGLEM